MTLFVTMLIIWIPSSALGYIYLREDHKRQSRRWTRSDRLVALILSALFGPVQLFVMVAVGVIGKLSTSRWGRKEARW